MPEGGTRQTLCPPTEESWQECGGDLETKMKEAVLRTSPASPAPPSGSTARRHLAIAQRRSTQAPTAECALIPPVYCLPHRKRTPQRQSLSRRTQPPSPPTPK